MKRDWFINKCCVIKPCAYIYCTFDPMGACLSQTLRALFTDKKHLICSLYQLITSRGFSAQRDRTNPLGICEISTSFPVPCSGTDNEEHLAYFHNCNCNITSSNYLSFFLKTSRAVLSSSQLPVHCAPCSFRQGRSGRNVKLIIHKPIVYFKNAWSHTSTSPYFRCVKRANFTFKLPHQLRSPTCFFSPFKKSGNDVT
jgi:hypothetical protein